MNSQTSTKQTKARPNKKMAESAENIFVKQNQNIYNDVLAMQSQVVSSKLPRLSTHRSSNMLGRTGDDV